MKPTEMLVEEHHLIRQALESLSLVVQKMEGGETVSREFFEKSIEFVRLFADKFHHFKEEYLMFIRLSEKKKNEIDSQIDVLRYQHDRGRNHVIEIENALDGYYKNPDGVQATIIIENLASYISLLRQHIHREDYIFYPMADEAFSPEEHGNWNSMLFCTAHCSITIACLLLCIVQMLNARLILDQCIWLTLWLHCGVIDLDTIGQ